MTKTQRGSRDECGCTSPPPPSPTHPTLLCCLSGLLSRSSCCDVFSLGLFFSLGFWLRNRDPSFRFGRFLSELNFDVRPRCASVDFPMLSVEVHTAITSARFFFLEHPLPLCSIPKFAGGEISFPTKDQSLKDGYAFVFPNSFYYYSIRVSSKILKAHLLDSSPEFDLLQVTHFPAKWVH